MKRQQGSEMPPRSKRRSSSYVDIDYDRQVVEGERRDTRRPVVVRDKVQRDPRDRERNSRDFETASLDRPIKRHKGERIIAEHIPRQERPPGLEYRTLLLSNLNEHVPDHLVKEVIEEEFKRFGEFNVNIVYNGDQRVAYVNFRFQEDAKNAKHARGKLMLFDRPVNVNSVYPKRSIGGSERGGGDLTVEYRDSYYHQSVSPTRSSSSVRRVRQDSFGHESHGRGEVPPQYENRRKQVPGEPRERFPHHLHHILPEDDEKATRTLFVGNLDPIITDEELLAIFERFGIVEDIDIKRPPKVQGNAYAFLKFANLDMAHRAKVDMSGQHIGKYQCKIGYGKANPSTCLWVGGLGPWIRPESLEREFDRFGVIHRIEWPQGKNYAYVLFDNVDAAQAACQQMRGVPLGGPERRLRIDFTDPAHMDRPPTKNLVLPKETTEAVPVAGGFERRDDNWQGKGYGDQARGPRKSWGSSDAYRNEVYDGEYDNYDEYFQMSDNPRQKYSKSQDWISADRNNGNEWESNNRHQNSANGRKSRLTSPSGRVLIHKPGASTVSHEKSRHDEENGLKLGDIARVDNISDLAKCLPVVWSGALILKNSAFAARMHLLSGEVVVVDNLMRDLTSTEMPVLRITQRLRLDQPKLEEVSKRVLTSSGVGHSVLLAMPGSTQAVEESNTNVQQRPLRNLMTYLKQKEAAGVVSLPPNANSKDSINNGVLYAFPPCTFSHKFLAKKALKLGMEPSKDDHLVVVVVRAE